MESSGAERAQVRYWFKDILGYRVRLNSKTINNNKNKKQIKDRDAKRFLDDPQSLKRYMTTFLIKKNKIEQETWMPSERGTSRV